jgi:hypothetical protein
LKNYQPRDADKAALDDRERRSDDHKKRMEAVDR